MQTFIIPKYELKNRWDPYYNLPRFKDLYEKLQKCPHHLSTLKQESSAIFSGTTPLSGGDAYTMHNGIPFIRSGDFSEDNIIDFSKVIRIKKEVHNGKMRSSQLRIGDVLIAIVGATIGKIGVYKYDSEANINQAICSIRLKKLNPYYVQAFYQTNVGQLLIEHIKRPVARANINLEEVGGLPIPLVDTDLQQKIVDAQKSAFLDKQKKEEEAIKVLLSIDEYLLSELGIERPSPTRTEIGRFFYTSFRNIMGGELAPLSVKNKGQQSKSALYKETKLSTIATIEKGQAITSKDIISGDYPVIAGGQSSPYNHNQYNYKGNVVTVSASGAYSGYVWYHDYPIFASDCSVIYSKDEKMYLTKYIYEILHLRQQEIYLLQKGAGQPHVYASDLAQITIPIIPLEKQREIIMHCNKLRATAEKLKQEGMNLVESVKKTIEAMILGE